MTSAPEIANKLIDFPSPCLDRTVRHFSYQVESIHLILLNYSCQNLIDHRRPTVRNDARKRLQHSLVLANTVTEKYT